MDPPSPETWPQYADVLPEWKAALPNTQLADLSEDLATLRVQLNFQRTDPVPGVSEKEIHVTNSSGTAKLRALVYYPTDNQASVPVYAYFHAGGFMVGKPELMQATARAIVKENNVVVFAPSYRLTPEHAFPAGVDDVWDWTLWIAHHAKELGIHADPGKGYILAGESVGGNMALVAALRARDTPAELEGVRITGVHVLCAQLCSNKAIPADYKKWYTSYEQCRDAPVLSRKVQDTMVEYLKPDETSFKWNPLNHPKGLGNLPPTFIMTAGFDPSRDDNLIGEKMMREKYGVKTRLNVYRGVSHVFWINFTDLEVTKQWARDRREGINWLLAGGQ